jgi:hypoxanthine phosphoribosyltransferase
MTRVIRPDLKVPVLYAPPVIAARVEALAAEIAARLGTYLLAVAVLKGSFMFAADLLRALHRAGVAVEVDFMMLSSYHGRTQSSGQVTVERDITSSVAGRRVLLLDDILESGRTLAFAKDLLVARGAHSVDVCVLLDKPGHRVTTLEASFTGFACPDRFVVGYGMDVAHCFRELPYIGVLED